jgi:hypothetical protein
MTAALPPFESEYAKRVRATLNDLLPRVDGADAELIETALSRGFDILSDEQVARLNVVLRRFAAPVRESRG